MITTIEDEAIPETVVVVQPNRSLSWQANLWIIAGVAACSVLLALIFIIRGQWVVLVFIALTRIAIPIHDRTSLFLTAPGKNEGYKKNGGLCRYS